MNLGGSELLMLVVVVVGLFVYPTIAGLLRSSADKEWGWFWAILAGWVVALGWVIGWLYILGPGKRTTGGVAD